MRIVTVLVVLLSAACVYSTPVENGEPIAPAFDAVRDVRILLYTRNNRNNPQQLNFRDIGQVRGSHFEGYRPTRVLVHGWLEDDGANINTATSQALLDFHDFNVLFIDWSAGSQTIDYIAAFNRVPHVGQLVADYLDFLSENGLLQWHTLTVIGFSLGAHIAGITGKRVRHGRIHNMIGLDPAGPLFSQYDPSDRIDASDAEYVECIHTNGPFLFIGAGIGAAICDSDFFPNGGESQPGCLTNTCSHGRSVDLYVESLRSMAFYARRCEDRHYWSERYCNLAGGWMGGDSYFSNKRLYGSFYLNTNRYSPYAQGPHA